MPRTAQQTQFNCRKYNRKTGANIGARLDLRAVRWTPRVSITATRTALAKRAFGREQLKPSRGATDGSPSAISVFFSGPVSVFPILLRCRPRFLNYRKVQGQ